MKTTREITRDLALLFLTVFAVASARGHNLPDAFNAILNGGVESLAVQADGKILLGGFFTVVGGQPRTNMARLNPDGTLDTNFVPRLPMYGRRVVALPSGKVVVGGIYNPLGQSALARALVRFETNGSVDTSFDTPLFRDMPFAVAVQADGKVVAGFQTSPCIARFNTDGSLDTNFLARADVAVYDLVIQPDGKILAAGYFNTMNNQPHRLLARLNADGSVDSSFNTQIGRQGEGGAVRRVAVQADGKIVFGGGFFAVNGVPRQNLARVNADGTLDVQFNAGANGEVHGVLAQPNGRIVIVGDFTMLNGQPRVRVGRVNWDGSLDPTLTVGADGFVRAAALQSDGKILVGGQFTTLGGATRLYAGRINADANPSPIFIDAHSVRRLNDGAFQFSFLNGNAASLSVLASDEVTAPLATWANLGVER